ncbi:MAG: hypothetical protein H7829_07605 [Magnetococcus sp. THC-1_WYH]
MARPCSVCAHKRRADIDQALVAGETFRALSRQYTLSKDALRRHKQEHLPKAMAEAQKAVDVAYGDNLLDYLGTLRKEAHEIKNKAEKKGNFTAALGGIRELVRIVELLAKMRGELQEAPSVNLFVSAEWTNIQAIIVKALAPYPEARQAVVQALEDHR